MALELAKRTRFLRDEVVAIELEEEQKWNSLSSGKGKKAILGFYEAFKKYLIASLTEKQFADLYSQTLTYGLFAARTRANDEFNRELAFTFIPNTIGILKDVFRFISLGDPPKSLQIIIEDITEVLKVTDVKKYCTIITPKEKGKTPLFIFTKLFLQRTILQLERNAEFIIRRNRLLATLSVRLTKFLKLILIFMMVWQTKMLHCWILAGGTLTFPAEAIKIAVEEYSSNYGEGGVDIQLLRGQILQNFYSFELMMAPYAIGHLKMGFLFEELGYPLKEDERFKLYLTNTLETEDLEQISIPGSVL